jgi:SAM-dependent methyltransferase
MSSQKSSNFFQGYYSSHFQEVQPATKETLERYALYYRGYFRPFLPPDRSAPILDAGAGYGSFLYFLKKEGYTRIEGVDRSEEQVSLGRSLGIQELFCKDIEEFLQGKKEDSYERIFAIDLLEHLPEEKLFAVMGEFYRVLKEGGKVVVRVPNGESPFFGKVLYGDLTHFQAFTPRSIRQLFSLTGFFPEGIFPTPPIIHGVKSLIRRVLWEGIVWFFRFYHLIEGGTFQEGIFTRNLIAVGVKKKRSFREKDNGDPLPE